MRGGQRLFLNSEARKAPNIPWSITILAVGGKVWILENCQLSHPQTIGTSPRRSVLGLRINSGRVKEFRRHEIHVSVTGGLMIITAIQTHVVCQTSCNRWKLIKILIGPLSWATVIVFLVTSVPTLVASSVKCVRSTYSVPGPFFFQTIPINSLPMGGTFLVCETWRHFRESEWD
jgi:hypothetical protein